MDRKTIDAGKVIGNYEIIFLIGLGGFGDVYKVKDKKTSQMFALKTEKLDAPIRSLGIEIECLEHIDGNCFPKMRTHGTEKKFGIQYLVMNILGASIGNIRRSHNDVLPLEQAFPIASEMLKIIERYHSFGYVHRDIKPSNFLTQQNPTDHIVLIDFGLCKKHINPDTNEPFPFEEKVKFMGTKKYASPNAHNHCELGRVDDLYSWFYSLLEIANGNLPWNEMKDNKEMLQVKTETPIENLVKELPAQIIDIYTYIKGLKYEDKPDYAHIHELLNAAMADANVNPEDFNWSAFYSAHANLGDIKKTMQKSPEKGAKEGKGAKDKDKDKDDEESEQEGGCCSIQ